MKRLATILFAFVATVAVAAPPQGHSTLPSSEWKAIQQVIGDQLTALKAGDGTKAIAYSIPGIRQRFGTPDRFMRMVRESYSPLLDARSSTFLPGGVVDGVIIQPLQLVLPDNTVLVALYQMVKVKDGKKDGNWRIAGCEIAPSTAQAT